jgi:hypothetical protein
MRWAIVGSACLGCGGAEYGGMSVPCAKRLKLDLETENAGLKERQTEAMLDSEALKAALGRTQYPHIRSGRPC